MKKIAMLGAGAWGTSISHLLADNGYHVGLWSCERDVVDEITQTRFNTKYLPNVHLADRIVATNNLSEALHNAEFVFEATPVKYLRTVCEQVKRDVPDAVYLPWVILSKGIEQHTHMLPSQILHDVFGKLEHVVVGGPNFAQEVAAKAFTTTTVASHNQILAHNVAVLLHNRYFKTFLSNDDIGVQLAGAFKNVIALAAGIAAGAGYKENARAYIVTQGLHEMAALTQYLGGKMETMYGLSGLGDLFLTAASDLSKNVTAGKKLGSGVSLDQLEQYLSVLPEGINTVQSIHEMITKHHLVLPLSRGTYDFIFQGEPIQTVLEDIELLHPSE